MSSVIDDSAAAAAAVLTYKAPTPAIPVTLQPTPEELAFDWTLSPQDLRLVVTHRGAENRLREFVNLFWPHFDTPIWPHHVTIHGGSLLTREPAVVVVWLALR